MKNLANCSPVEFLQQTNKIRRQAADWIKSTGVLEIRKRMPDFTGKETPEERKEMMKAQVKKNLDAMMDELLENHAEETADILGLMCFLSPEETRKAQSMELISNGLELLMCKEVRGFLLLLMRLAQSNTDG